MEMNQCAWQEFGKVDYKLNATYQKIIRKLNRLGQFSVAQELKRQELTWISQLETQCAFERMDSFPGSMARLEAADCRTDMANRRIAELRKNY